MELAVVDRLQYLSIIPRALGLSVLDAANTVTGIFGSILSVATLGKNDQINQFANYTLSSRKVFSPILECTLKVLNPKATFTKETRDAECGIVMERSIKMISETALKLSKSEKGFEKHVLSRGLFVFAAPVALIARITDLALGILVAGMSLVTLGVSSRINNLAMRQLTSLALINDVMVGMRWIINPHQKHLVSEG